MSCHVSQEYYIKYKMGRASASGPKKDSVKTLQYFQVYNHSDVYDVELAQLVAGLGSGP